MFPPNITTTTYGQGYHQASFRGGNFLVPPHRLLCMLKTRFFLLPWYCIITGVWAQLQIQIRHQTMARKVKKVTFQQSTTIQIQLRSLGNSYNFTWQRAPHELTQVSLGSDINQQMIHSHIVNLDRRINFFFFEGSTLSLDWHLKNE